jgi:hypothetical protein
LEVATYTVQSLSRRNVAVVVVVVDCAAAAPSSSSSSCPPGGAVVAAAPNDIGWNATQFTSEIFPPSPSSSPSPSPGGGTIMHSDVRRVRRSHSRAVPSSEPLRRRHGR